jgi:hypothetical protein
MVWFLPHGRYVLRLVCLGLFIVSSFSLKADPPAAEARFISAPVVLDGKLDEYDWSDGRVFRDFIRIDPDEGTPASFDTEVKILFDESSIYIAALCRDSLGPAGIRVPTMMRDFDFNNTDLFGVVLDPFGDGKVAFAFQTSPYGTQRDQLVFNGQFLDVEWDGVWEVRTALSDSGWTAEIRIPWTTLRYPNDQRLLAHSGQIASTGSDPWRINFHRRIRRLNEMTGWSPWPRAFTPYRTEYMGYLHGIQPPAAALNLRAQPFLVTKRNRLGNASVVTTQAGLDAKWAVTPSMVFDATLNTDFAQAEVDRQVINVTRFSVFFPERRPFFLENAGLFSTGISGQIEPFFSRRIGLDAAGQPIPIDGGVRLTGRVDQHHFGGLLMRQRTPAGSSTFGVGRYVHHFGANDRIGAMLVSRVDDGTDVVNHVGVVDSYLRFGQTTHLRTMVSGSTTRGAAGDGVAALFYPWHTSNAGYFGHYQVFISKNYHPATGFVSRKNLMITSPAITLDWRPAWKPRGVRAFRPGFTVFLYHSADFSEFQEGWVTIRPVNIDFENGSALTFTIRPDWQNLRSEFEVLPGIRLARGYYRFERYAVTYEPDVSKPYWAFVTLGVGKFYNARNAYIVFRASPIPGPHWNLTLDYTGQQYSGLGINNANTETHLVGASVRFALNPQLQFHTLAQYNTVSKIAALNARLSYEFAPLSFVYLVINDSRLAKRTPVSSFVDQQQVILKVSYLMQM